MGIIQVRHIKSTLERQFGELIDLSDLENETQERKSAIFLTRALAAYSLMISADLEPLQAAKSVVDMFDDNGLDAIYIDQNEHLVYIIQAKFFSTGKGSPSRGDVQKFIQGFKDLIEGRFDRFNAKIQSMRDEIMTALDDAQSRFMMIIAYSGQDPLSNHAQRDFDDMLSELNDTSEVVVLKVLSQRELHKAVTGEAEGDPISIDVVIRDWGQRKEPYFAVYGQVAVEDIAAWWEEHGNRLFERNLRKFIPSGSEVNQAITNSLKMHPEKFWYLNNGITALCTSVVKKPMGGSDRSTGIFRCEGVTIVNGAQTVGSIAAALIAGNQSTIQGAYANVKFISLENCPDGFASEVTRATNTQNRIEPRDFVSLDPLQHRLREELWVEGKEYAYKTGDPTPPPDKGCNIDEATVALACANPDVNLSVIAKSGISKLWVDINKPPYNLIFNQSLTGLRLWRSVEVLRTVEFELKEVIKTLKDRNRMVGIHGNRLILHMVFRNLPTSRFDEPDLNFNEVLKKAQEETGRVFRLLTLEIEVKYQTNYLHSLFKNVSKCRELADSIVAVK